MASLGGGPAAAAAWPLGLGRPERRAAVLRALLLAGGGAAAGYAAYRLYRSDTAAAWREQVARLRAALVAYADAFGTGADTLALLASDLRSFLASDRTELPPSLRQLARLMQSPEVAGTTSATVAALIRGVAASSEPPGAAAAAAGTNGSPAPVAAAAPAAPSKPALDRILDALLSDRGHSLVSVAVSLGARNLVTAYCDTRHRLSAADAAAAAAARAAAAAAAGPGTELPPLPPPQPDMTNRLLDFLASPRGQQVAVLAVTAFVTGGMRAYLDQTIDINFYEELFSAMARPEHLEAVKACVGVFARDVVGTYLAGPSQQLVAAAARPQPAAAEPPALRLSRSIQELFSGAAPAGREQQGAAAAAEEEAPADTGSPCASSASGEWRQQQLAGPASAPVEGEAVTTSAASDIDSDVLLQHPAAVEAAKGAREPFSDSGHSQASSWAVRTPPGAGEAAAAPALPQLRRVQQQSQLLAGVPEGMQRTGSGNLEWISAVGKEWLNVAQHPQGRSVMVELAGAAAKEAAAGVSAALVDRLRLEWMLVAAFAMLLLAWLMQRMLAALL
ncbi:hypothetical protein ABPG75_005822 [Micractinium tetrahymenae]